MPDANPGLGRPRRPRRIRFAHQNNYFKPRGVPLRDLEVVRLTTDELEALRLKNLKELDQAACAQAMNISQSTFQRILSSAYRKLSDAVVNGKGIEVLGG